MHPNIRLTPYTRKRMMTEYQQGTPAAVLANRYGISRTTFYRWRNRYLSDGVQGLCDRSSKPHRIKYRLTQGQVDQLVELRCSKRFGPARLSPMVGLPQTTIYRCLRRHGMGRLPRPPRPPVVRIESKAPGELVHLDVLHLWPLEGKKQIYQFTLVDGYTRMAYATTSTTRSTDAALEAVQGAQTYFGFPIRRVLTDNDVTFDWTPRPGFRGGPRGGISRFTRTITSWNIRHSLTRIRRPQTNGKVERFHRTIQEELYRTRRFSRSELHGREPLAAYLHHYNNQRHHTALGGITPVQRKQAFLKAQGV